MKPLLSIIMPVYNSAEYLKRCIESILNQKFDNIELLIVNDGSTDESEKIIEEFLKIDKRIIYIKQENMGVSAARNAALKAASGKYITFVDSDDYVEKNIYTSTISLFEEKNIDILFFGYYRENQKNSCFEIENDVKIINQKEYFDNIFSKSCGGYLWNKIYLKEKIHCYFDESIHMCEDLLFNMEYIKNVKKAGVYEKKLYHYIMHDGNSMKSGLNLKTATVMTAYNKIEEIIYNLQFNMPESLKKEILMNALKCKIIYREKNDMNEHKELDYIIDKYYYESIRNSNLKVKLKLVILKKFPKLYTIYKKRE